MITQQRGPPRWVQLGWLSKVTQEVTFSGGSKKNPQGRTAGFELSLEQKKCCAEPSEMKPAGLEVVRVICWFISVPGGFRLD